MQQENYQKNASKSTSKWVSDSVKKSGSKLIDSDVLRIDDCHQVTHN